MFFFLKKSVCKKITKTKTELKPGKNSKSVTQVKRLRLPIEDKHEKVMKQNYQS
jgi:hypothetical protein